MTGFQVYHMCRDYGKGSSKFVGVEGASSMGTDSLDKGKAEVWGGGKENIWLILTLQLK